MATGRGRPLPYLVLLGLSYVVTVLCQDCPVNEFLCTSSTGNYCIPSDQRCDSILQCADGADERGCPLPYPDCAIPEYERCPGDGNSGCFDPSWRCDLFNDCADGSDEDADWCRNTPCPNHMVKCTTWNLCIPGRFLCNGVADCPDGSAADEPEEYCNSTAFTCPSNHFTCQNGNCIPEHWICDSDNDCGDGSDEDPYHDCSLTTCRAGYFRCTQNKAGLSACIPDIYVCDGLAHCEYAEDELPPVCNEIPADSTCAPGYFRCDNSLCVHNNWICDRDDDCGDKSDEADCAYGTCAPATEMTCGNGRCVRRELMCDGRDDCRDNSDEDPSICGEPPPVCTDGKVLCDNECLLPADCQINQCMRFPSPCSQVCTYLGSGQHSCSCRPGYALLPDGVSCLIISSEIPSLLFCNKFYLRSSSIYSDGTNGAIVARDFSFLVAFDFDNKEKKLYATDVASKTIINMNMDGTDRRVIVPDYVPDVEGIAVDWVGRKLYWTDRILDVLEVSELNGTSRRTLVRENLFEPRAVVVDPKNGYVYWTDWGLNAYIGRIGMDGTDEMELHSKDIVWPNGITIDYPADRIYWTDAHLDYIAYADLDFNNVHQVINDNDGHRIAHPFSVSVFEDTMYWTDWNLFKVYSANKRDGSNVKEVLTDLIHRPMDIHVLHSLRQDTSLINPCGNNNGGCSHLCLIRAGGVGFQCACPDNYRLLNDTKTCEADCLNTQYLCYSDHRCIPWFWECDGENDCLDGQDEANCPDLRYCDAGYFQCHETHSCLHPNLLCNGNDDCNDGSDEAHCADSECQAWEFRCDNGKCIQHVAKCDQTNDCGDNSDEGMETCEEHECYNGYFKCDNGNCIPQSWYCDLDNDCGDNSDEPVRDCERRSCETGWFSCATTYRCVPGWAVCYGGDHCRDNSDEIGCDARTCDPLGEFRCNSQQCIPIRWYCDLRGDCPDNSDEPIGCAHRECSVSEFRCQNERCIPGSWHCDGDFDCGGSDMSDESQSQCIAKTCPPDLFQCTDSGHCIDNMLVCDGRAACADASDEASCPTRFPGGLWCPTEDFFTCDNTVCIPKWWVCDGQDDCLDNSDESNAACDVVNLQCNSEYSRWQCEDGMTCILEWELCDNIQQCPDGSDESRRKCDTTRPCNAQTEFSCGNGNCIPNENVCDGRNDCSNDFDEKECSGTCDINNGNCEQICVPTDGGKFCNCRDGYVQDPTALNQCLDIDECVDHPCPQICHNLQPSANDDPRGYRCECALEFIDYSMNQDATLCGIGGTQFILIGSGKEVVKYYPLENRFADFVRHEAQVEGVDFHPDTERVYFIDRTQQKVKEVNKDATSSQVPNSLGVDNLYEPIGIAVDWLANNIYFTDYGSEEDTDSGRPRRAAADRRAKVGALSPSKNLVHWRETTLIYKQLERPTGIAVNPDKGLLYWTDLGSTTASTPKIEMAWMNGANRQEISYAGFVQPSGLSIDFNSNQTVYFCDQKADIIGYFGWDGWNVRILASADVLSAPFGSVFQRVNPYQLDVFESYVYYTTSRPGTNYVMRMGKNSTDRPPSILFNTQVNTLGGIKVYHERRYWTDRPNVCARAGCTDMCLLTPIEENNFNILGFDCVCGNTGGVVDDQIADCDNDNPPPSTTTPKINPQPKSTTVAPNPPPVCRCQNGGVCTAVGQCSCPDGFVGQFCDRATGNGRASQTSDAVIGTSVGVATLIILLLILVVVILLCYVKKKKKHTAKPVTYRTGGNVDFEGAGGVLPPPLPADGEPTYETTVPRVPVTFENPGYGGAAGGGGPDPEKTGLPPDFADVLPEKVDLNIDDGRGGMNPYTNMPIGGIDPYNQMVVPPPEPPPAYSASEEKLDEI